MSYNPVSSGNHDTSLIDADITNEPEFYNSSISDPVPPPSGTIDPPPVRNQNHQHHAQNASVFLISFYSRFFDLNTSTFFSKIHRALNPLNKSSTPVDDENESPEEPITELYGFIWITGSLIAMMFFSSTAANLLSQWLHSTHSKYHYDFGLLIKSVSLFYGYNIALPIIIYFATSYLCKFPIRLSVTKLISIYGYTNVLWFPITIINILIVIFVNNKTHHLILNLLEWTIVAASGLVTGLSNVSKISPIVFRNSLLIHNGDPDPARRLHLLVLGLISLAHLFFTFVVKASFFGIV